MRAEKEEAEQRRLQIAQAAEFKRQETLRLQLEKEKQLRAQKEEERKRLELMKEEAAKRQEAARIQAMYKELERLRLEKERVEMIKLEKEKAERERQERETRAAKERQERMQRERFERQKAEAEMKARLERERLEREERARLVREERERVAREEREKKKQMLLMQQQLRAAQLAKEEAMRAAIREERERREKEERERREKEQALERERLQAMKAKLEALREAKAKAEREARELAERKLREEKERRAKEKRERKEKKLREAREREERERARLLEEEMKRLEEARLRREQAEREKQERERRRLEAEAKRVEQERLLREKIEQEQRELREHEERARREKEERERVEREERARLQQIAQLEREKREREREERRRRMAEEEKERLELERQEKEHLKRMEEEYRAEQRAALQSRERARQEAEAEMLRKAEVAKETAELEAQIRLATEQLKTTQEQDFRKSTDNIFLRAGEGGARARTGSGDVLSDSDDEDEFSLRDAAAYGFDSLLPAEPEDVADLVKELGSERGERLRVETELKEEIKKRIQLEVQVEVASEEKERLGRELADLNARLSAVDAGKAQQLRRVLADATASIQSRAQAQAQAQAAGSGQNRDSLAVQQRIAEKQKTTAAADAGSPSSKRNASGRRRGGSSPSPRSSLSEHGFGVENEDADEAREQYSEVVEANKEIMLKGSSFVRHYKKELGKPVRKSLFYREEKHADTIAHMLYMTEDDISMNKHSRGLVMTRITDIYLGKQTLAFRRHISKKAPESRCMSFATSSETIDLEAKSTDVRDAWVIGVYGMLRSIGCKPILHRVPLFVNKPISVFRKDQHPIKLQLSIKCKDLPKMGKLFKKRHPLVRCFEKDASTGKYHYICQTEQAKTRKHNPIFDMRLDVNFYPGEHQTLVFAVSFHESSNKLKFKYRLGYVEVALNELMENVSTDFQYRLTNPQKKSFNGLLKLSRSRLVVRCNRRHDMDQVVKAHKDALERKRDAQTEKELTGAGNDVSAAALDGHAASNRSVSDPANESYLNAMMNSTGVQDVSMLSAANNTSIRSVNNVSTISVNTSDAIFERDFYAQASPSSSRKAHNRSVSFSLPEGSPSASSGSHYSTSPTPTPTTTSLASSPAPVQLPKDVLALRKMMVYGRTLTQFHLYKQASQRFFFYKPPTAAGAGTLFWCEGGKREESASNSLQLASVTDVYLGKHTKALLQANAALAKDEHCFSLLCDNGVVLELETKSEAQRDSWVFGILGITNAYGINVNYHDY